MNKNLNQTQNQDQKIEMKEITSILFQSKGLIISFILFFLIISYYHANSIENKYRSTALVEIGYYEFNDGGIDLIEKVDSVIASLKVSEFYKSLSPSEVKIDEVLNRLVRLTHISDSAEESKKILERYINRLTQQHSKISKLFFNSKIEPLSNEIDIIQSEIDQLEFQISDQEQLKYIKLIDQLDKDAFLIRKLDQMYFIENTINLKLVDLKNRKKRLNMELKPVEHQIQNFTPTQIIGVINTAEIQTKNKSFIMILGLLTGIFSGVLSAFIRNFFKRTGR
jgi:LPS O-antigen subunit length determinant protein (WzzB/FepE family)